MLAVERLSEAPAPGSDAASARVVVDRVVAAVDELRRPHGASPVGPYVSVSLGVSVFDATSPGWHRDRAAPQHADLLAHAGLQRCAAGPILPRE